MMTKNTKAVTSFNGRGRKCNTMRLEVCIILSILDKSNKLRDPQEDTIVSKAAAKTAIITPREKRRSQENTIGKLA